MRGSLTDLPPRLGTTRWPVPAGRRNVGASATRATASLAARAGVEPTPSPQRVRALTGTGRVLAAVQAENRRLRSELDELKAQVRRLEVDQALREASTAPPDAFDRWIEDHLDELVRYEGEFVAIHPSEGIVFHAPDDETFGRWLAGLPRERADQLLPTHANKYL